MHQSMDCFMLVQTHTTKKQKPLGLTEGLLLIYLLDYLSSKHL
jgi:hypothetical protein